MTNNDNLVKYPGIEHYTICGVILGWRKPAEYVKGFDGLNVMVKATTEWTGFTYAIPKGEKNLGPRQT